MSFYSQGKKNEEKSIELGDIKSTLNQPLKKDAYMKNQLEPPKNDALPNKAYLSYYSGLGNSNPPNSERKVISNPLIITALTAKKTEYNQSKMNLFSDKKSSPEIIPDISDYLVLGLEKCNSENEEAKYEILAVQDTKNLIPEQKKSSKQQVIKNLEDSLDKNSLICTFCFSIIDPTDSYKIFLCKHASCFMCIFNRIQEIISESLPKLMTCSCNEIVYYYLFGELLDSETLGLYVEMISKIPEQKCNQISLCPYDMHKSKSNFYRKFTTCEICNNKYCGKCGQSHENQTCLEYYEHDYKLELLANIPKCTECKSRPLEIELPCECKLCLDCAKHIISDFLYNISPTDDPKCKTHQLIIPRMYVYGAFGGEYGFIREQEKAIDYMILSPKFICEICLNEHNVNKSITLECEHRFCPDCLKLHLNTLMIDSSSVGNIMCPKCNKIIPYDILKSNSNPEVFEKYLNFTVMTYKPEKIDNQDEEEEVMKWCIKCNFGCLISINEKSFKCPNCRSECCPKCNKKHYYTTCDNLRQSMASRELKALLGYRDDYFNNFMKNCSQCPNCREAIEKVSGCNFMECKWPRCKDVYFCAICNKRLSVRAI